MVTISRKAGTFNIMRKKIISDKSEFDTKFVENTACKDIILLGTVLLFKSFKIRQEL